MGELLQNIIVAIIGLIIGYVSSLLIARYNAKMALQRELKNAIATRKGEAYIKLWQLCDTNVSAISEMDAKRKELNEWYTKGGGLFLTFKAANHFFGAQKLLETDDLQSLEAIKKEFTWLRTEMKVEVGSYSRKEADTYLPNTQ